ncbi:DUF4822 domain-containing protein [Peribacillus butanolivorans]
MEQRKKPDFYKRTGKDKDGKDINVYGEHESYKGDLKPKFTK